MIETKRLYLKIIEEVDIEPLYWLVVHDPKLRNLTLDSETLTKSSFYGLLSKTEPGTMSRCFVIYSKAEESNPSEMIGLVTLNDIDFRRQSAKLGSMFIPKAKYEMITLEVGKAIMKYGFNSMNLNKFYAYTWSDNSKMSSLYKRLGCSLDGTLREDSYKDGVWVDKQVWSILRREFNGTSS